MSVADNIRLLDAGNKALNDHDVERFLSLHLPSVIQRDPQNVEPTKGREAVRAGLEPMIQAFPDFHVVRERAFGDGDWVVEEGHALGTHRGPLETPVGPPIPATNKSIRLPYAFIAKVEGGKFAETHLYFDVAGVMGPLGRGPPPPPGGKPGPPRPPIARDPTFLPPPGPRSRAPSGTPGHH